MSLNRNRQVRPLTEELKEIGLDPQKTLGEIHRTTALIDKRMGGGNGGGAPAYASGRQLQEVREQPGTPQGQQSGSGEDLEEAMRAVKKKRVTMGEKLKAKRSRRKRRSSLRKAAKMYYKKFKRKIAKRAAKKLKKFGKAGLEKLHKMGRRIVMSDDQLANLREELNSGGATDASNQYEDAAFSAGMLALYLGEIFEAAGDQESAETMYDASDAAADLSEALAHLEEEDEPEEEQEQRLESILDHTVRALKVYEGMGAPSLFDVLEAVEVQDEAA
jgi:hypothetical protein